MGTDSQAQKLRAVYLSALLVMSVVVGGVATMGVAGISSTEAGNAAGSASISALQTAGNEVSNYVVSATYPSVGSGNDTVVLNFTDSGADFAYANVHVKNDEVTAGGQTIGVGKLSVASNDEQLIIPLNQTVPTGSSVSVSFTVRSVRNPGTTGTQYFTVDLRDGATTTTRAGGSIDIVEGGDITGTVTDADTGSAITDSSTLVEIYDKNTNKRVTGYGVNPSTGQYTATVPAGTYYVNVSADGYVTKSTQVSVTNGGSVTNDVALDRGGFVNGTIVDGDGDPVSGLYVTAIREGSGTSAATTQTAADGTYSLALDPATPSYAIYAGGSSGYEFDYRGSVTVTKDQTTTVNLTTPETPATGTVSVTVEDSAGNPVSNAKVYSRSSDYAYGGLNTTDGTGVASVTSPAGTYVLRVDASGYGSKTVRGVSIPEGGTNQRTITLADPAYVEGTAKFDNGTVASKTQVLVSDGDEFYPTTTDGSGEYNVTVGPGTYSVSVFARDKSAPAQSVTVSAGESGTADFTLVNASVNRSSATIASGPGDDSNLGIRTNLQSGLLQLQLVDESSYKGSGVGKPDNLTSLGVTESTEFSIELTVTNFDPTSLIWGLRNADWETSPNETVENGTDITITGSTVDLQAVDTKTNGVGPLLFQSPSQVDWPTDKAATADVGFSRTVYFGLFDLSTVPGPAQSSLNGISTTTNAQRFAPPTYKNDTLRVWMAAPSTSTDGQDHTGFYQATIPDSQLDAWGVDDPETELDVSYKDRPASFSVTETADGARILVDNISYSASYAEISPDESAISESGGDSGEGDFQFSDASLNASTVQPGESVEASVFVENEGTGSDSRYVTLRRDGDIADERSVSLDAGENTTVRFATTFDSAGEYDLSLEGVAAGTVTVEEDDGGAVAASTPATATGTDSGVTADDTPSDPTTPAGQDVTDSDPYSDPATESASVDSTPTATTGGSGPGFGPVAALVAALSGALLARRR